MTEPVQTLVGRQPIFDRAKDVAGYELLYRGDASTTRAEGLNDRQMTSDVLVNAFISIGIEKVTRGTPAFVNMNAGMVRDGTAELLEPDDVIVELLESVSPNPDLLRNCRKLTSQGYRIALDDFVYSPAAEPLLEVAHYVKVDVLDRSMSEVAEEVERLASFDVRLVAERVESPAVLDQTEALGFEFFQGYFFRKPETMSGSDLPVREMQLFRLLNLLRDYEIPDAEVEEVFRSAPSLTYRLLRIVNSAAVGGRGVNSIRHAMRMLGRKRLHRWMSVLLVSSLPGDSGVDVETAKTAIHRARFLELLALEVGSEQQSSSHFLLGLFSLLDALLQRPMHRVVEELDLRDEVRRALLHDAGPLAPPLELVRSYERGDWRRVFSTAREVCPSLHPADLTRLYMQSLGWARDHLASAGLEA